MIILATFKLPTTIIPSTDSTGTTKKGHNSDVIDCLSSNTVYNFHFIRLKDNNINSNGNIYPTSSTSSGRSGNRKRSSSGIILNSNNIKEYHVSNSIPLIVICILCIQSVLYIVFMSYIHICTILNCMHTEYTLLSILYYTIHYTILHYSIYILYYIQ